MLGHAKEAGIENKADQYNKELLRPIQLNMERHRYVLVSPSGPLMVSPVNAVESAGQREYVDHFACKQYSVSEFDEKIKSVAECAPVADPQVAEAIKKHRQLYHGELKQARKERCALFRWALLTQSSTKTTWFFSRSFRDLSDQGLAIDLSWPEASSKYRLI